jgi:hypothetical protein
MSLFIPDGPSNPSGITDCENASAASECSPDTKASKRADLAGPGIGDYAELEKILPLLTAREKQKAIFHLRRYIEDNLCKELG